MNEGGGKSKRERRGERKGRKEGKNESVVKPNEKEETRKKWRE